MYNLTTFYLTLYLRVALLISFLELPFGGPELGVNLAVIIVVLGRVITCHHHHRHRHHHCTSFSFPFSFPSSAVH